MMTVKQIREIKPVRVFLCDPSMINSLEDWDFVTTDREWYRIHRVSGETICAGVTNLFKDYAKEVEGLDDNLELMVDLDTYKAWQQTRRLEE